MSGLPDLEAWAIFAKIVETGSFSQTARELMLSQATVSKAITRLEERMKITLFHRTSRKMTLTDSGMAAIGLAEKLLQTGELLEIEIGEQANHHRGNIRFTVPMSFGLLQIAPLLPEFMQRYPEIHLEMNLSDEEEDLINSRYDFALRITDPKSSSLIARKLCDVPILLVGSPSYFERYGKPEHPRELVHHKALSYSNAKNHLNWKFTHPEQGEYIQPIVPIMLANNAEAFTPTLLAGIGIALQPEFMVHNELQNGTLTTALDDWETSSLGLYALTPPHRNRPQRVKLLMEFLRAKLKGEEV
ncbi:LysR family transcriptional regulator [Pasteurella langaaensis DSM 22999]|uniref:LysR family transcriptional regulator n=1 Tax=Alitibacter langaaensis DSM 22999 TaxID=1122935 RepID=A0A2U0T8G2_9PAST|nr:LysR family transcriptional regulator [Pasteurella langaaensis]PVX39837.1 LysR family transcriptional regulator [Pasteurella langaaensis DSM 22999]